MSHSALHLLNTTYTYGEHRSHRNKTLKVDYSLVERSEKSRKYTDTARRSKVGDQHTEVERSSSKYLQTLQLAFNSVFSFLFLIEKILDLIMRDL